MPQRAKPQALAHSLNDFFAVAPFVWREHHRFVYLGIDRGVGGLRTYMSLNALPFQ
jgi:hypothetical protein